MATVAVTLTALGLLEHARTPEPTPPAGTETASRDRGREAEEGDDGRAHPYDGLSGFVLLVGFYNGVAPFIARLAFDSDLLLALPLDWAPHGGGSPPQSSSPPLSCCSS